MTIETRVICFKINHLDRKTPCINTILSLNNTIKLLVPFISLVFDKIEYS